MSRCHATFGPRTVERDMNGNDSGTAPLRQCRRSIPVAGFGSLCGLMVQNSGDDRRKINGCGIAAALYRVKSPGDVSVHAEPWNGPIACFLPTLRCAEPTHFDHGYHAQHLRSHVCAATYRVDAHHDPNVTSIVAHTVRTRSFERRDISCPSNVHTQHP